jgi:hypothetical protein
VRRRGIPRLEGIKSGAIQVRAEPAAEAGCRAALRRPLRTGQTRRLLSTAAQR